MASIANLIFYVLIFLSVYVQVFLLVTFLENRKKIVIRSGSIKLTNYPTVTIVVPCWNEEKTVHKTIQSLLALNYPQDKLKIFLIDDGSTDNTWNVIKEFESYPNIQTLHKENGGKYTALNYGLKHMTTEFFGALDSDSYADTEALVRIMSFFEKDPSVMAVAPSVTVYTPKNFIQNAQKAEYNMGIYLKKMLGFLGAINVTPGPLTIFRKKVFDDLGPYRHGHNTEDMEIAYRMQENNYKIEHCNDAYVYTNTPTTIKTLYKQRLRWIYGFINNTIDYKKVLFNKKYGNFSTFTLPMGIISIASVSYLFGRIVYSLGSFVYAKILILNTTGWHFTLGISHFDPYFINIQAFFFLSILIYISTIFSMIFGQRMAEGKWGVSMSMLYFFPVFSIIAPFWLIKAVLNTMLQKKPSWR
jgi:cellulose synthase/poly-beta-1,6-N-acetylglucosamine synthase-like glycosyltransferase